MVKKHKSATNLTINFLSGEKILIQLAKESTMFVKKFLIYLKRNGGKLLIAQMIFADDGIKLNNIVRRGFCSKLSVKIFCTTILHDNLMNLCGKISKNFRGNYFSKTKRRNNEVNFKKNKINCSVGSKMVTNFLKKQENFKIKTFTSSTKGAPPVPLGWRTGGCQPWLFFFVFSSLINGVLAIENIQIFGGAIGGAIFSCVVFYISLCLYNKYYDKLFTNDNDNKKEAKMEEGKQVQKILTKQDETTEEEEPSSIEIDFTQASEIDNGVDKQEIIEKKDVLVKNFEKNVILKRSKSFTNLSIAGGSLKRCCSCREINIEMDNKSVCSSIDWEADFDDCVGGIYQIGGETCIECHIQPNGKTGLTPDEKMDLASHEAGHAFVAFLLGVPVTKITLLPQGQLLGHTLVKFGDKQVISKEEKEKQITCLWGGRESEKKLRGKITTMFKSDQRAIKEILEPMGPEFGLSDNDALYVFKAESEKFKGMKDDDKYLIGNNCKLKARQLIEQNAAAVEALASTLFGCEEMVGEQQIKETLIKLQQQYTGNK